MNNIYIRNILRFIFLIFFQIFIFNNIHFRSYFNPYIYVMFVLLLPFETAPWLLLISSFFLGFSIDLFSNTLGIHTASTVFMAFCRPTVLKIISSAKDYEIGISPGINDLGFKWFFQYSLILILLHHFMFFFLEVFTFQEIFKTIWRIILSSFFTLTFVILIQYLFYIKKR